MRLRRRKKSQQKISYVQNGLTRTEEIKIIYQSLETIASRGYNLGQVFRDWVELMFWAFQRNDPKYLEVVNRYKNDQENGKRNIDYFCWALSMLLLHMRKTNEEVLSFIYEDISINNKLLGQYFTPYPVCNMMAQINYPLKGNISDPACGAGRTLVACIKNMTNKQVDNSFFIGQDKDRICAYMCALNLMFFNVNSLVIVGDTLKMTFDEAYRTTRSYLMGGSLMQEDIEKAERFIKNEPIFKLRRRKKNGRKGL